MLKSELTKYQLLDDVVSATSASEIEGIVGKLRKYIDKPSLFVYDSEKARREKLELEKKKHEEGKRKRYEDRMRRKAKREGKPLDHYLNIGAELPTRKTIEHLRSQGREQQLAVWNKAHGQHCMTYHLAEDGCPRGRSCAFLHVDVGGDNVFNESDAVAG